MGLFARIKNLFSKKTKPVRVGIALGSGGAKGLAHLGALQAFEEAGIVFSLVAGTSIGSIVGALYAKGYSSHDMVQIIENLNRKEFAKNIRPFGDMAFAETLLDNYLEEEFSSLAIPFACWATDGATNEGKLLNSGKLTRALTASSAMPPFFKGVEIDGRKYYDGAFTNAVPADVVKEMGADIVIGIDLSAYSKPEEEKSRIAKMFSSALNYLSPVKTLPDSKTRGYDNADIMLRPDLSKYQPTDVSQEAMDKMYELGYEEAMAQMSEIKAKIAEAAKK